MIVSDRWNGVTCTPCSGGAPETVWRGAIVGSLTGAATAERPGLTEGKRVGVDVGARVDAGARVGLSPAEGLGSTEGKRVGVDAGARVGLSLGLRCAEGVAVGFGTRTGSGAAKGVELGSTERRFEVSGDGEVVGAVSVLGRPTDVFVNEGDEDDAIKADGLKRGLDRGVVVGVGVY